MHGVDLRVEGKPPLDGAALCIRVHAGGGGNGLLVHAGHLRSPCGRVAHLVVVVAGSGQVVLQFVVVGAPQIHELVVDEVLLGDDVQPRKRDAQVGAGTQVEPVRGTGAPPGEDGVDGDDLRPHLHALHQPVADVAVGVGTQRLAAPHHQHVRVLPFGIVVAVRMAHGRVHDGEVAHRRRRAAHARQVAGVARKADGSHVGGAQARAAQERHLVVDVAAGAVVHHDGLAAQAGVVDVGLDPVLDEVQRLVPRDALERVHVAAVFARTLHGILQPVGIVRRLGKVEAAHAQLAVRAGIQRIALHLHQPVVLRVGQDAARVVAARRRIVVRARDGVAVLFPLPFALVVGRAVDAVQELLVIRHSFHFLSSRLRHGFPRAARSRVLAPPFVRLQHGASFF